MFLFWKDIEVIHSICVCFRAFFYPQDSEKVISQLMLMKTLCLDTRICLNHSDREKYSLSAMKQFLNFCSTKYEIMYYNFNTYILKPTKNHWNPHVWFSTVFFNYSVVHTSAQAVLPCPLPLTNPPPPSAQGASMDILLFDRENDPRAPVSHPIPPTALSGASPCILELFRGSLCFLKGLVLITVLKWISNNKHRCRYICTPLDNDVW